jgi:hypothetical protein
VRLNHKRIERLYRAEDLAVRRRTLQAHGPGRTGTRSAS